MTWWSRLVDWWRDIEKPFDIDYPDSAPPVPQDLDCPDTEPTSPGALDSDLQRLT